MGRSSFTRLIDIAFAFIRKYAFPLHWLGVFITAAAFFGYAHLVAFTSRLKAFGEPEWPNLPTPSVLALWHGNAPSLVVIFSKCRPAAPVAIMIASDPRGDFLALLCRMLGFEVVRGSDEQGGWSALVELAQILQRNASVIITADGGGPARIAKVGAVALASATGAPLIPLATDCHPAIQESRKWDAARNPVPFCSLTVSTGPARTFDVFANVAALDEARKWLEDNLNVLFDQFDSSSTTDDPPTASA